MKQVNFDALRQIKAPEELINRTIQAAQKQDDRQPAAVYVPSMRRRLAIAASIVLVLGVSIFAYFSFRNINNESSIVAPATEGTQVPTEAGTLPTEDTLIPTQPDASVTPSGQPTEPATGVPTTPPTVPTVPVRTEPSAMPTQPATTAQPSTSPVIPTDAPTAPSEPLSPTDLPVIEPTEPPEPWDPPYVEPTQSDWPEPVDPTEPWEPSTDPPSNEPVSLRATFRSELLTGSKKVYCAIYENGDHDLIGGDRFSSSHEARIVERIGDYVVAEYEAPRSLFPAWKMYRIVFYNEDGESIKVSGRYLP